MSSGSSKAYYDIRIMLISKETRHFNLLDHSTVNVYALQCTADFILKYNIEFITL